MLAASLLLAAGTTTPATSAIEALARQLRSRSAAAQEQAATALGRMGPSAAAAIAALENALRTAGDTDVPAIAAWALGEIGRAAVPALLRGLAIHDENVRTPIVAAVARVGPEAIPALVGALASDDAYVRDAAAEALGRIGPPARDALPALLRLAQEPSATDAMLSALAAVGRTEPERVLPVLVAALADADPRRPLAAEVALRSLGAGAAPSVPALAAQLSKSSAALRAATARTLGELGPLAAEAAPALTRAQEDGNAYVRTVATEALRAVR